MGILILDEQINIFKIYYDKNMVWYKKNYHTGARRWKAITWGPNWMESLPRKPSYLTLFIAEL